MRLVSEAIMSLELEERQSRKSELEKELQTLNEIEEFLGKKMKILEEKLAVHRLKRKLEMNRDGLKQFVGARTKLKGLEERLNLKEHSRGYSEVSVQPTALLQNEIPVRETLMPECDSTLENRVHLSGNVIFSWSYQKLP